MALDDLPAHAAWPDIDSAAPGPSHFARREPLGEFSRAGLISLLIVIVRVGAGLLIERVVVSIYGVRPFPPVATTPVQKVSLVDGFFRWDSLLYQQIVQHGYSTSNPALTSFFPLYPLTVRAVARWSPLGYRSAALVVAWVSLWFGVWGVIQLAYRVFPDSRTTAWRAGVLLAFFPVSVFLISGYAESTFIALSAWCLVALTQKRLWLAAVLAGLASCTRPEGLLLALAVVLWKLGTEWPLQRASAPRVLAQVAAVTAIGLSGVVAFSAFVWARFGTPLEYLDVQKLWHRHVTWPFHPFTWSLSQVAGGKIVGAGSGNVILLMLVNDGILLLAVAALVALIRATRASPSRWWLWVPAALAILLVASNGPFGESPEGAARVIMCITPLYLVVARIRRESVWTIVIVVSAILGTVLQGLYNTGGWVT